MTFLLDKRPADALAAAERSPSEFWQLHGKALALHDLGRAQEAQRLLDEFIGKARAQRDAGFHWLKLDVLLRSLRGDARFTALAFPPIC